MEEIHLASQTLFQIGPLPVTNTLLATWIGMGLLFVMAVSVRNTKLVPTGVQNVFESILEFLLGMIEKVTQDRRRAEQFLPLLATFFLFILVLNWLELIPGFGTIHVHTMTGEAPLLRGGTTDLNTPLALALISVVAAHVFAIAALGLRTHLGHYFAFKPTVAGMIDGFVGLLHLVSEVAKVFSFSFRLFGNIFAGQVLLIVIAFLVPYILPVPFYLLEIFVGFIQALVFTMLSLVFLTIATTPHHETAHSG
ncbi:MAG: F0F1 ATP synthase subunit A [Patescibacteria group bacterium]